MGHRHAVFFGPPSMIPAPAPAKLAPFLYRHSSSTHPELRKKRANLIESQAAIECKSAARPARAPVLLTSIHPLVPADRTYAVFVRADPDAGRCVVPVTTSPIIACMLSLDQSP
jgi:hypothetical protein